MDDNDSKTLTSKSSSVLALSLTIMKINNPRRKSRTSVGGTFDCTNKRMKTLVSKLGTDRISHLPDELLHRILSFLPHESVTNFLFLSKRFLSLWTTLPVLCFEFKTCNHLNYFDCNYLNHSEANTGLLNFVENLLSCRDKSIILEKFCLSSPTHYKGFLDMPRVNTLIKEVILRHVVREIDLEIRHPEVQFCSPFLVSCNSLTSLKLSFDYFCTDPFPARFSFPNLKTMNLKKVVLCANFASQLINCSKLENLVINSCTFSGLHSPTSYEECSFGTLPNLFKASISLDDQWGDFSFDILRVITNVEVLRLDIYFGEHLDEQLQELDYFSKFHNLKTMEFGERCKMEIGVGYMDSMLRGFPALESLSIRLVDYVQTFADGSGLTNRCRFSEHLKVIRIGSVYPDKLIKVVKYFLEQAKALEKMVVRMAMDMDEEKLEIFYQELQALPNGGAVELIGDIEYFLEKTKALEKMIACMPIQDMDQEKIEIF